MPELEKRLGKIERVKFGIGGYNDSMLGLHLTFRSDVDNWVANYSNATLDAEIVKWNERCQWTEEERDKDYANLLRYVSKLLKDAKVDSVEKLKGIPVEVTFENRLLKEWRILTEVL